MKDYGVLLDMLYGPGIASLDKLIEQSIYPNLKCSISEITEKTNVKEHEILMLLDKGIFKGKKIFGVKYVMGYSARGVENRIKNIITACRKELNE